MFIVEFMATVAIDQIHKPVHAQKRVDCFTKTLPVRTLRFARCCALRVVNVCASLLPTYSVAKIGVVPSQELFVQNDKA